MSIPKGYNPMGWDCDTQGCFNRKKRPKIELFADCFPRNISPGDVDARVEYEGFFWELEWKGNGAGLKYAQKRTFQEVTRQRGNAVFVVEGDAETMDVKRWCIFWMARQGKGESGGLEDLKERVRAWVEWVDSHKREP